MNPGEVRLLWFPFSRAEQQPYKRRPVLILSSVGQPPDQAILVAMITSSAQRLKQLGPGDVLISRWQQAGLKLPSVVRCRRLWTAENRDFTGPLFGTVDQQTLDAVRNEVRQLLV